MPAPLCLASASPRRRDLLQSIGLSFSVVVPDVDETPLADEAADAMVERLAQLKATTIHERQPGDVILAADTTVVVDGESLGKPVDEAEAAAMLRRLSGRWHAVFTGVAVVSDRGCDHLVQRSTVRFIDLDDDTIADYLACGESMDKAGAYAIQGVGAVLIAELQGSYSGVMGLPLTETHALLRQHGVSAL